VPGSGWRQAHNKYSLPYIAFNDGLSEAAFISFSQAGIPGTGYTSWWYHDKFSWAHFCFYYDYIREADVVLNADQFVDPGLTVSGSGYSEKAVAQHELMHSAGLGQGLYAQL